MIDLYTWPTPNGHKLHIMMEESGLEYQVIPINTGRGDQFKADFLKISPNNKIPALVDPDGPGGKPFTLFESGAMLIYLADKSGKFLPAEGTAERLIVIQWLMFQMGGIGPMFGQQNHFNNYAPKLTDESTLAYSQERYNKEGDRLYGVLDRQLGKSAYLASDDYTIADIATYPWARLHEKRTDINNFPNVKAWIEKIDTRPAVQRGLDILSDIRREGDAPDAEALKNMFGDVQYEKR